MVRLMTDFKKIKSIFNKKWAERDVLRKNLSELETKIETRQVRMNNAEQARVIFQEVAKRTQQNLEYHISNLVTLALSAVFPDPPKFIVKFETRRNQTECDLLFSENGSEPYKPINGSGGGVMDVASFALTISVGRLEKEKRPIFIMDEPFRYVSPGLQGNVGDMLSMINKKLNIQLIIVSHAEDVNQKADKTFTMKKVGQITETTVET